MISFGSSRRVCFLYMLINISKNEKHSFNNKLVNMQQFQCSV